MWGSRRRRPSGRASLGRLRRHGHEANASSPRSRIAPREPTAARLPPLQQAMEASTALRRPERSEAASRRGTARAPSAAAREAAPPAAAAPPRGAPPRGPRDEGDAVPLVDTVSHPPTRCRRLRRRRTALQPGPVILGKRRPGGPGSLRGTPAASRPPGHAPAAGRMHASAGDQCASGRAYRRGGVPSGAHHRPGVQILRRTCRPGHFSRTASSFAARSRKQCPGGLSRPLAPGAVAPNNQAGDSAQGAKGAA